MTQKTQSVDLWAYFWNRCTTAVGVKCHRRILASEAKNEVKLTKKGNKRRDSPDTILVGLSRNLPDSLVS